MRKSAARAALAILTGLALAGCTVQPLNAPAPRPGVAQPAALSSIYIEPVNDRVGQETRNALIFLLNGGAGQPSDPVYRLKLSVRSVTSGALIVQVDVDNGDPTAHTVTVSATYELSRSEDGTQVATRRASASASYDNSGQEFANTRAERDAQNRAAREVAERLRALIAADLSRAGAL